MSQGHDRRAAALHARSRARRSRSASSPPRSRCRRPRRTRRRPSSRRRSRRAIARSTGRAPPRPTRRATRRCPASPAARSSGIPGSISDKVETVTASGENAPNETKEKAFDGSVTTKWLVFANHRVGAGRAVRARRRRRLRPHLRQRLARARPQGLHARGLQRRHGAGRPRHADRPGLRRPLRRRRSSTSTNTTAYSYYRLDITANHGDGLIQLAELAALRRRHDAARRRGHEDRRRHRPGQRPQHAAERRLHRRRRRCATPASHTADGRGYAYNKVFDVDVAVTGTTQLSYKIFPELTGSDLALPDHVRRRRPRLHRRHLPQRPGAVDQHGVAADARRARAPSKIALRQPVEPRVSRHRRGRRRQDDRPHPASPTTTRRHGGHAASAAGSTTSRSAPAHPVDAARRTSPTTSTPRRGTNSSGSFSRGNNFPATAVPQRLQLLDAGDRRGLRRLALRVPADEQRRQPARRCRPSALSHEPSPWMGDRQTFQVMPSAATGTPDAGRAPRRALAFSHDDEIAQPVLLRRDASQNGLKTRDRPDRSRRAAALHLPRRRREPDLRQRRRPVGPDHRPAGRDDHRLDSTRAAASAAPPGCSSTAPSTSR